MDPSRPFLQCLFVPFLLGQCPSIHPEIRCWADYSPKGFYMKGAHFWWAKFMKFDVTAKKEKGEVFEYFLLDLKIPTNFPEENEKNRKMKKKP